MFVSAYEKRIINRVYCANRFHQFRWVAAIMVLYISGAAYRAVVSHLDDALITPISLPVALEAFPLKIDKWTGQDVSVPESVIRIAGNDDYIYRIYRDESTGHWVNVYVAYSGRPRTMVGHRPDVCYGAAGWVCDGTVRSEFQSSDLRSVPCLIHRFRKPGPDGTEIVVLNYYILNGRITNDAGGFSGLGWRTPNIDGDPARYVAQVQISGVLESQTRSAAESMTALICDYLPDENGFVKAAETAPMNMILTKPAVVQLRNETR
jgi:hypothetical protein